MHPTICIFLPDTRSGLVSRVFEPLLLCLAGKLVLLSKLVPSATAHETTADALELEAFVPLVRACDAPPSNRLAYHGG